MQRLAIVLTLLSVGVLSGSAAVAGDLGFWDAWITNSEPPSHGGVVHCEIYVFSRYDVGELTIELIRIDSLDYSGPREFACSGKVGDTCRHTFDVVIPDSVLSGVEFYVRSERIKSYLARYFAPLDDSVIVLPASPQNNSFYRDPYAPPDTQMVLTPEDIYGKYEGPTVTSGFVHDSAAEGTSQRHSSHTDSIRTITHIDDTTGLVVFGAAGPDPNDSTWVLLYGEGGTVARMPKDLFFKHYMPKKQPKIEKMPMEAVEKADEGTPR